MDSNATTNKRNSSRNNKSNSLPPANPGQAQYSKMSSFSTPPHQFSISDYNRSNAHLKVSNDAISRLPQVFDSLLSSLSTFCQSGQELASLLGIVLEDTPLATVANTYHDTCEELSIKCTQQESLLRQQITASCQKMGPLVSSLRSSIDQYSRSGKKYEALKSQYESLSMDSKTSQAKVEQLQLKFESSRNEFNHSLAQLSKTTDELDSAKMNVLGTCFLSLIQTHAKLLSTAAQALGPLSEMEADTLINAHPVVPLNATLVQDLTLNWLSSAQVYSNLRECGGSLPSNVISDLTNWKSNEKRRAEINIYIDSLIKSYISEISNGILSRHTLSGGFHLNPKGIALALKGCVSELESAGAGFSPLPSSSHEARNLIQREIPHIVLTVKGREIGAASGSDSRNNFQEKLSAVKELVSGLVESRLFSEEVDEEVVSEIIKKASIHVLALSCHSVISRSSKIAATLLYGRSNLVMVRESPLPEEAPMVTIAAESAENGEPFILIESQTVWWLVEDNGVFLSPLSRFPPTHSFMAKILTDYAIQVNVEEFIKNLYYQPFIPSFTVQCAKINEDYLSLYQTQSSSSSSSKHHKGIHHSSSSLKHHRSQSSLRYTSSESEGIQDDSPNSTVTPPSSGHSSDRSRTGSGLGAPGRLYRSNSNDSISTATSNVTLKANQFDGPDDIMNILVSNKQRGGLTQNSLLAHTNVSSRHRYSHRRKELGSDGRREEKDKIIIDKSSRTSSESDSIHASNSSLKFTPPSEDFNTIYDILGQPDSTSPGGSGYFDDLRRDPEDSEREFLSGDTEDHVMQSQIINNDDSDLRKGGGGGGSIGTLSSTTPLTGSSSGADSGIHVDGVVKFRNPSLRTNLHHLPSEDGSWSGFESIFNRRLGPICHPGGRGGGLSSDSDSETTSGRNSRDANIGDSPDELPGGRSSSSASLRSSSRLSHIDSSDTSSLPDTHDYQSSFNHAPGSHRINTHHKRQSSLSSYPNGPPLSQDGSDSSRPSSFSQEVMISQDIPLDRDLPYPGSSHFSNPYDHEMRGGGMQGGGTAHSQFLSDPYPGAPPPPYINDHHHQRRIDFRRPPPPGPGPYWDPGFTPPGHMIPPPLPQMRPHPPPPHDMYHHGNGYRATTPEISPAPSPHPTPPTTPPPPMITMQPSPIRLPPNPRPHPFRGPPPHNMQFAPPPRGIPPHHRPPLGPGMGPMPRPHPPPPRGPMVPPPHPHGRHMPPGPPHGRMHDWGEWHH